jgi:hypothetical protein
MFKLIIDKETGAPKAIKYQDTIILQFDEHSFVTSLFAQKVVNLLNRNLLSLQDLDFAVQNYKQNKMELINGFSKD